MPAEPTNVVVVRDPHDGPATRDWLTRIDNLPQGVLVVRPVPGTTSPSVLALAVLAALGKQVEPRPRGQSSQWWPLAQAWAAGHQVHHVVVDRAHTLPARLIRDLIDLANAAEAITVWFIDAAPHPTRALAGAAAAHVQWPGPLLTLDFSEQEHPCRYPLDANYPEVTLPAAGFLTFRYACRQQIDAPGKFLVEANWSRAFEAACRWLHRNELFERGPLDDQRFIAELPDLAEMTSAYLAETLYTTRTPQDRLVGLRAIQAAMFTSGLLLHHETRRTTTGGHGLGCPLTPNIAAAINRGLNTQTAAAAVLHTVYPRGGGIPGPPAWRLADIHPTGTKLLTKHGTIPVPACGQAPLRAFLHWLHATGTINPETPLGTGQDIEALAKQGMHPVDPVPIPDVGYRRSRAYQRGHATPWMRQRGLELSALAELGPSR